MTPLAGLPLLSAAEMRAAEASVIAGGQTVAALMELAGTGIATWTARLASGAPISVLCGPGNNGGDGYVAARILRAGGANVSVAALGPARTPAAIAAAEAWGSQIASLDRASAAPVVVDAILGLGASRALEGAAFAKLRDLAARARLQIAVDLPSGLDADGERSTERVVGADITLALGALNPAHLLQPGAALCGEVRCIPLGIAMSSSVRALSRLALPAPGPEAHKYSRGLVVIVEGAMPGAARLAAEAALRAGAGYALVASDLHECRVGAAALVRRSVDDALADARTGALVIGCGLGRDNAAVEVLGRALASGHPLVIDGDALHLLGERRPPPGTIVTPHAAEFAAWAGKSSGNKIATTLAAAEQSGAVVVHKGADTVIAAPDGRVAVAPLASAWLSTAGTGDVLAGAIGAMRAGGLEPFAAACAGVWLHAKAATDLGPAFIADDLAAALTQARAQ